MLADAKKRKREKELKKQGHNRHFLSTYKNKKITGKRFIHI
jgi:hypothetical protein